jgi:hypothetical protein
MKSFIIGPYEIGKTKIVGANHHAIYERSFTLGLEIWGRK